VTTHTEAGEESDDGSAAEHRVSPAMNYELIRENRALLMNPADAGRAVLGLRIDAVQREIDHLKLSLGLQHASAEVSKLQIALAAVRQTNGQTGVELQPASTAPALADGEPVATTAR